MEKPTQQQAKEIVTTANESILIVPVTKDNVMSFVAMVSQNNLIPQFEGGEPPATVLARVMIFQAQAFVFKMGNVIKGFAITRQFGDMLFIDMLQGPGITAKFFASFATFAATELKAKTIRYQTTHPEKLFERIAADFPHKVLWRVEEINIESAKEGK